MVARQRPDHIRQRAYGRRRRRNLGLAIGRPAPAEQPDRRRPGTERRQCAPPARAQLRDSRQRPVHGRSDRQRQGQSAPWSERRGRCRQQHFHRRQLRNRARCQQHGDRGKSLHKS